MHAIKIAFLNSVLQVRVDVPENQPAAHVADSAVQRDQGGHEETESVVDAAQVKLQLYGPGVNEAVQLFPEYARRALLGEGWVTGQLDDHPAVLDVYAESVAWF